VRNVLHQQGEFVATQARRGVLRTQRTAQALRYGNQEGIAGCVSLGVIQVLESIEIQKQDTAILVAAARSPMERNCQSIQEQRAIWQSGEHIMQRIVL
jgi:hypothetical protein